MSRRYRIECNVCHRRTETVVLHSEGAPAYRELSLHDGMTWPLHSCRSNPNPFPQPVLLAQTDPFRPTAGSCRYNALRSPTAGVGQGGGSTS